MKVALKIIKPNFNLCFTQVQKTFNTLYFRYLARPFLICSLKGRIYPTELNI